MISSRHVTFSGFSVQCIICNVQHNQSVRTHLWRSLRTFIGLLFILLQQSQEGCVCYGPSAIQDHHGVKHVRVVCHNVSGRGVGGLCHCEEALNGNSWHQRSQLTTRTITYWTKKPMEKQHRIYVIGFWVTDPIHVFIVLLQLYDY